MSGVPPAPWICKYSPPPPLCGLGWMQVPFQGWVGPACGILPPILKVPQLSWASLVPPPPADWWGVPGQAAKTPGGLPHYCPSVKVFRWCVTCPGAMRDSRTPWCMPYCVMGMVQFGGPSAKSAVVQSALRSPLNVHPASAYQMAGGHVWDVR